MPDVFMPRLSDTMTEGAIAQWNKAEGDQVQRGDVLAEIETDKAVMDLEAYESGVLEKILVQPGETVPIGAPIAVIGDGSGGVGPASSAGDGSGGAAAASSAGDGSGGGAPASVADAGGATPAAPAPELPAPESGQPGAPGAQTPAPEHTGEDSAGARPQSAPSDPARPTPSAPSLSAPSQPVAEQPAGGRLKASPVVRSLARTHGIDLSTLAGTGPGGRIIRADVEQFLAHPDRAATPSAPSPQPPSPNAPSPQAPSPAGAASQAAAPTAPAQLPTGAAGPDDERVPLSTIRRVTARRLTEAAMVPAFQLTTVLDASRLVELRADINARLAPAGIKVSVTDLLVRGCAVALRAHPEVNASFGGDAIIRHRRINIGIAVALEDGLIVPVITDTDRRSVSEIGAQARDLAARARAGKLKPDEFTGGTFTVSNLGMYGIDNFTAVLNPPEAAILAVGSTVQEPVVIDGEVQVRPRMRLTLTVDHRVLDGATGAAFLRDLTDLLAEPLRILV